MLQHVLGFDLTMCNDMQHCAFLLLVVKSEGIITMIVAPQAKAILVHKVSTSTAGDNFFYEHE